MTRARLRALPGAICLDTNRTSDEEPALARASLEALRREHHLILNAAGEGIYGLDTDGRTHFVNPAAAAMTGHDVSELIGRSMHDIVHHTHADGRSYARAECPIYAAFGDGMVRTVGDEVFWRKDGTSFPVEYTSTPIVAAGRVVGAVVVFRDVTVRRRTEHRLRAALAEVQTLKEKLQEENRSLKEQIHQASRAEFMVGESAALRRVSELVRRFAPTESTVLVTGESGTGKELVCRAIHEQSAHKQGPLVTLNSAALSSSLVESELFGHERGSFTGAASARAGRFELAASGTLFLDEIGELPLEAQAKLLRVLEQRQFERVGGTRTLRATARIVAATNRDLRELVRLGRFRSDLYYRLYVMPIAIPPLRERREDIPLLVEHFRARSEARWGKKFQGLAKGCLARLKAHDWPGNVRELEHAVERAVLVCDASLLDVELSDLAVEPAAESAPRAGQLDTLAQVEREHILRSLEMSGFRVSGPKGAAAKLGLHPNTLRYRMSKLGIVVAK